MDNYYHIYISEETVPDNDLRKVPEDRLNTSTKTEGRICKYHPTTVFT